VAGTPWQTICIVLWIETYLSTMIDYSRLAYTRTTVPAIVPDPVEHIPTGPVLLLHGMGADHRGLLPLTRHWPGVEVIAPDLPGFGRSQPLHVEHSIINYAHVIEALCAHNTWSNLTVIGHSLGASIALAFAALYPRRVRALVLICPVTTGRGPLSWLARGYYRAGSMLPDRAARIWFTSRPAVYLTDRATLRTNDPVTRRHILAEDYRSAALSDPAAITHIYRSLRRTPFTAFATAVRAPTQLIAADHDALATPPAVIALQHQIRQSQLTVISGAGHLWPAEEPTAAGHLIATSLHTLTSAE
jgi:pimeloyl-ACP methyl ester carboxylesterase